MSHKKIQQTPEETLKPNHDDTVIRFLAKMMSYTPQQMHFFDEASVISTSGNRTYGHSVVGTRAVEVQRYASNASLTVNVCCSYFGIDHYNIINGPSNAFEMINFFDEALQETNDMGNPKFSRGDVIVMDNCGFHHHRQGEQILKRMLDNRGISLVFQPPYSPQYNVTECVFQTMRHRLHSDPRFVSEFTELAVVNALDIPNSYFCRFF